jgi:hypothetical protein
LAVNWNLPPAPADTAWPTALRSLTLVPDQGKPVTGPAHSGEQRSLDQNALALAALLSPDNVFVDLDWLGDGPDGWRLDEPAAEPLAGPADVADAALAEALAAAASDGE